MLPTIALFVTVALAIGRFAHKDPEEYGRIYPLFAGVLFIAVIFLAAHAFGVENAGRAISILDEETSSGAPNKLSALGCDLQASGTSQDGHFPAYIFFSTLLMFGWVSGLAAWGEDLLRRRK